MPIRDRLNLRLKAEIDVARLALDALDTEPDELRSARTDLRVTQRVLRDLEASRRQAEEEIAPPKPIGFIGRLFFRKEVHSGDLTNSEEILLNIAIHRNKVDLIKIRIRAIEKDHYKNISDHYVDFHQRRAKLVASIAKLSRAQAALEKHTFWKPTFGQLINHVTDPHRVLSDGISDLASEEVNGDYTAKQDSWGVGILKPTK